jgi:hypothetical protein
MSGFIILGVWLFFVVNGFADFRVLCSEKHFKHAINLHALVEMQK